MGVNCTAPGLIWDWFPISGHEITRNTIIHLKESEIPIIKHHFKLKVSGQKFCWILKFSWANVHSTCNMDQLQLLKAKPRLSQHHSSTLPLSVALELDQVPAALSFSDCNMAAKKMPKISMHPSLKWNHVMNMKVYLMCYPPKMSRMKMQMVSNHFKKHIFRLDSN